jgi:hypothetical protein
MSPELAQKIIPIVTSPYYQMLSMAMLGSGAGALAGIIGTQPEAKKIREAISKDTVDPEKIVAKYEPNVSIISNKKELSESNIGLLNKLFTRSLVMREDPEKWRSLAVGEKGGKEYVLAPKKVNKYLLGHELGHLESIRAGNEPSILSNAFGVGLITGKTLKEEEKAWERSPIEGGEELKDLTLGRYKTIQDLFRIGAGLGAAYAATRHFGPKILEYLRR